MNILTMPRGGGKTTQAIGWLLGDRQSRVIVTFDGPVRFLRRQLIDEHGFDVDEAARAVIAASEARNALRGRDVTVFVDELEWVLHDLLGAPVEMATTS